MKKLKYYYLSALLGIAPAFAVDANDESADDTTAENQIVENSNTGGNDNPSGDSDKEKSAVAIPGNAPKKFQLERLYPVVDLSEQDPIAGYLFELSQENTFKKLKGSLRKDFTHGLHYYTSIFYHSDQHKKMAIDMLADIPRGLQFKILLSAGPQFVSDFLKSIDDNIITTWVPNLGKYENLRHSSKVTANSGALALLRAMFDQVGHDLSLTQELAQYFADEVFASWTIQEINDVLIPQVIYPPFHFEAADAKKGNGNTGYLCFNSHDASQKDGYIVMSYESYPPSSDNRLISFGPYVDLEPGHYKITLNYWGWNTYENPSEIKAGTGMVDIIYKDEYYKEFILQEKILIPAASTDPENAEGVMELAIEVTEPIKKVEVRTYGRYDAKRVLKVKSITIERDDFVANPAHGKHEQFAVNTKAPKLSDEKCKELLDIMHGWRGTANEYLGGNETYKKAKKEYEESNCGNDPYFEVDAILPTQYLRPLLFSLITSEVKVGNNVSVESQGDKATQLMTRIHASEGLPQEVFTDAELCESLEQGQPNQYAYMSANVRNIVFELCEPFMFDNNEDDEGENGDWGEWADDAPLALGNGEDII